MSENPSGPHDRDTFDEDEQHEQPVPEDVGTDGTAMVDVDIEVDVASEVTDASLPVADDTPIDAEAIERAAAAAGSDVDAFAMSALPDDEVTEEPHVAMGADQLKAVIEALVFASPEPLTLKSLLPLLDTEPEEDVVAALAVVRADYESRPGLQWVEVAGGYQIVTRPELHEWVRSLFHERTSQKLSVQALETLAVVAYKQPITALEASEVRGVNASGVLSTLLERHLVKIVGRKNVVGRPFLYATTKEFLIRFGLNDLSDLPRIEDMAEALGFDPPAGLTEVLPKDEMLPLTEDEARAVGSPEPSAS